MFQSTYWVSSSVHAKYLPSTYRTSYWVNTMVYTNYLSGTYQIHTWYLLNMYMICIDHIQGTLSGLYYEMTCSPCLYSE